MPAKVNLDALIPREDFQIDVTYVGRAPREDISIENLREGSFFYQALRKPDFQRETAEWEVSRVVGLIRSYLNDDLIPAVILWKAREHVFVIDGSHRLSALIAWVNDDYGNGRLSRAFFGDAIPDEQITVADRTRDLIHRSLGSYEDHVKAASRPDDFPPDVVARARQLGSLSLKLQWVTGNAIRAEESFKTINRQAARISEQELDLLQSRRKPSTICARAIYRRGAGHKYWSRFPDAVQAEIESVAAEVHNLLFTPDVHYPLTTIDLPAGGPVYSGAALGMVYGFVKTCAAPESPEDDADGERTVKYLKRCRHVMRTMVSRHPSSLGLHPAVYFYSWTGKQQPILFLTMADLVIDWDRRKQLPYFTKVRGELEHFLVGNRPLVSQIIRKFGSKKSGFAHMRNFLSRTLQLVATERAPEVIIRELQHGFPYLQPSEGSEFAGTEGAAFSENVRSGVAMRQLLLGAPKCAICGGFVPTQAFSVDHDIERRKGGSSGADNAQVTHPYCNSGIKG